MTSPSKSRSKRQVIGTTSAFGLMGIFIVLSIIIAAVFPAILEQEFWNNPEVLYRRKNENGEINFGLLSVLGLALFSYAHACILISIPILLLNRFESVYIEDGYLIVVGYLVFKKVEISEKSAITVKLSPIYNPQSYGKWPDWIVICHLKTRKGQVIRREIRLPPWFFQESTDKMIANFAAGGIEVTPPPAQQDLPT